MMKNILNSLKKLNIDYLKICDVISQSYPLQNATYLYLAVLSAEDKYFLYHKGVSIKSLFRALVKKHGGASTINMQLVRTITNRREITIQRKIREMILSLMIDFKFSKKQILDSYLENAYFGYKLNGIHSALELFFGNRNLKELSIRDNCFIASLLKRPYNPSKYIKWNASVDKRIEHILFQIQLNEENLISKIKTTLA
ncbi:TPA: biosynthetic peptidoglycan transglycosylase [Citrobacter gillenii]